MVNYGRMAIRRRLNKLNRMGKGTFSTTMNISRNRNEEIWRSVNYCVSFSFSFVEVSLSEKIFDLFDTTLPYERRMEKLRELKPLLPRHVKVVESIQCKSREHLSELY